MTAVRLLLGSTSPYQDLSGEAVFFPERAVLVSIALSSSKGLHKEI